MTLGGRSCLTPLTATRFLVRFQLVFVEIFGPVNVDSGRKAGLVLHAPLGHSRHRGVAMPERHEYAL